MRTMSLGGMLQLHAAKGIPRLWLGNRDEWLRVGLGESETWILDTAEFKIQKDRAVDRPARRSPARACAGALRRLHERGPQPRGRGRAPDCVGARGSSVPRASKLSRSIGPAPPLPAETRPSSIRTLEPLRHPDP